MTDTLGVRYRIFHGGSLRDSQQCKPFDFGGIDNLVEIPDPVPLRHSIKPGQDICPLSIDVFLFHGCEESQHAILDELEWRQYDTRHGCPSREAAVTDFINLVLAIDNLLQMQAESDTGYFVEVCGKSFYEENIEKLGTVMLEAYRYQYILSGATLPHFQRILRDLLPAAQLQRGVDAIGTLMPAGPVRDWMAIAA